MTLVEFLHPIKSNSHRDKCLAILYYKQRYENVESLTAQQIQQAMIQTRMPNAKGVNVPDAPALPVPLACGASPMRARSTSGI